MATGKGTNHIPTDDGMRHLPRDARLDAGHVQPRRHRRRLRSLPRRRAGHRQERDAHRSRPTSCESCHATTAWKPATRVDHAQVDRHAARAATTAPRRPGKTATHIATTRSAAAATGRPRGSRRRVHARRRHRQLLQLPQRDNATGKSANHIATSNCCETCHTPAALEARDRVDHTQVTGTCFSLPRRHHGRRQGHDAPADEQHLRGLPRDQRPGSPRRGWITRRSPAPAPPATTARRRPARAPNHIPTTAECGTLPLDAGVEAGHVQPHRHHQRLRELPRRRARPPGKNATHMFTTSTCEACHATSGLEAGDTRRSRAGHRHVLELPQRHARPRASRPPTSRRRPSAAAATARRPGSRPRASATTASPATASAATTARTPPARTPTHLQTSNTCESCHSPDRLEAGRASITRR